MFLIYKGGKLLFSVFDTLVVFLAIFRNFFIGIFSQSRKLIFRKQIIGKMKKIIEEITFIYELVIKSDIKNYL